MCNFQITLQVFPVNVKCFTKHNNLRMILNNALLVNIGGLF